MELQNDTSALDNVTTIIDDDVATEKKISSPTVSPSVSLYSNPFLSPASLDTNDFMPFSKSNFSLSPTAYSSFADETVTSDNLLHHPRYQQLYNRYTICLSQLQEIVKEVDDLRLENDALRAANTDLVQRLSLASSQAAIQNCLLFSTQPAPAFINDFSRLSLKGNVHGPRGADEVSSFNPTSVMEHDLLGKRNVDRASLPKSISVRSSGYLKMNRQAGQSSHVASGRRVPSVPQRVYVPGEKEEEEGLEFEVYNQGIFKTELCNKWQEKGTCPYGDNCQFAHGITELRPVIRHPRYKTEVCRMVLAGDVCPYGHRCHFRHSLAEQE